MTQTESGHLIDILAEGTGSTQRQAKSQCVCVIIPYPSKQMEDNAIGNRKQVHYEHKKAVALHVQ